MDLELHGLGLSRSKWKDTRCTRLSPLGKVVYPVERLVLLSHRHIEGSFGSE